MVSFVNIAMGQMFLDFPKELKVLEYNKITTKVVDSSEIYQKTNILYVVPMKYHGYLQNIQILNNMIEQDPFLKTNSIVALQDATPECINEIMKNKPRCLTFIADFDWLKVSNLYINDSATVYGFLFNKNGEVHLLGHFLHGPTRKAVAKRLIEGWY